MRRSCKEELQKLGEVTFERYNNEGEQRVRARVWGCRFEGHRVKMEPGLGFGGDHGTNIFYR